MKQTVLAGVTSRIEYLFIRDAATGLAKTGLAYNTSGLAAYYMRSGGAATSITLATQTATGAWSSGGFVEISSANMPGLYRLDVPDAVFAASVNKAVVVVTGTNVLSSPLEYQLVAYNPDDAVRLGLTALPNAAAEASGGLPTLSAAQASNGTIQANVHRWLTGTPNALSSGRVEVLVGAVTNGVIAAASFAANALDAVWSTATRTLTAASDSSGVTTLLSRLSAARAGYLDNLSAGAVALEASLQGLITTVGASAAGVAAAVWASATRLLTAGTNIVLAKGTGVTGFNDLSAAQVNTEADTALADVGVTATVTGRMDVAISTRAPEAGGNLAAVKAKTDNLPSDPADASDVAGAFSTVNSTLSTIASYVDTEVAAIKAKTDKLTFDADNAVDANIQKVNDVALVGDGDGTPWGPV